MFTLKEKIIRALFAFCGLLATVVLVGIFALLIKEGSPAVKELGFGEFFSSNLWRPDAYGKPQYGIFPAILSTLLTTAIALAIGIPLGIGTAAYLSFVASSRVREILKPSFELLASIPSVVIGFLGLVLISPFLAKMTGQSNGLNALNGGCLLALMSLPTIISVSEDTLAALPKDLWRGSLALGATRFRSIVRVMIPAAKGGVFASVMLGMGRAVGETMTVLMAAGNSSEFPHGLLSSVKTLTATIAMELGEVPFQSIHYHSLFFIGGVLFVITFFVNLIGELVVGAWKA